MTGFPRPKKRRNEVASAAMCCIFANETSSHLPRIVGPDIILHRLCVQPEDQEEQTRPHFAALPSGRDHVQRFCRGCPRRRETQTRRSSDSTSPLPRYAGG